MLHKFIESIYKNNIIALELDYYVTENIDYRNYIEK